MSDHQSNDNSRYIQWKSWSSETFYTFTAKDNAVFSCEMRRAGIRLNKDSVILEIGFGNGSFARWSRKWTSHYVGTESNPELIARAQQAGIEAHSATLDLGTIAQGRLFDLIAIFDVIEHLDKPEILTILESARDCLSANGSILIRVPSGDSPFSGHLMYGDITHKTRLGGSALRQLATLTRLKVLSLGGAAFPIFGLGLFTLITRLPIAVSRFILGSVIRFAYYSGESVVLTPNMICVLQRDIK